MENSGEKRQPVWMKAIAVLLLLADVFLILGGVWLLTIGKETGGAVICIAVGAVGLLFFGGCAFLMSHHGNGFTAGWGDGIGFFVAGGLLLVILGVALFFFLLQPIRDMEHYRQVWQNPITVTAVVTDHKSYDDDDDTDYKSFVTYIYDNVCYKDAPYEDRDIQDALTPIGTTVTIQISPRDPSRQIAQLKGNGRMVPLFFTFLFFGLATLCKLAQRCSLTRQSVGILDTETIQSDIKAKIRGRVLRPFLLFCWISYGFLYWQYSVLFGQYLLIAAVVCGAGWLCCMYTTVRDYRCVENGDFEVRRDTLVEKKEQSDSDGTSYILVYENDERKWNSVVSKANYIRGEVGSTTQAAYLPGKKKPIVHYDPLGNAR